MTDAMTPPTPSAPSQAPLDLNFEPRVIQKSFEYQGQTILVHHYAPTRVMRNRAMLEAVDTYRRDHPDLKEGEGIGGDPNVLEKELACRMIKWWNLPKPPRVMWDWLPVELGEKLVDCLEIKELFAFEEAKGKKMSSAAENAKN